MRQPHMPGQGSVRGLVPQIVANVREEGPLWLQPVDNRQGILHRRVRGMGLVPQCIEKQDVEPLQLMQRRFRNLAVVGQVRSRAEPVAVNLRLSVNQDDRFELHSEDIHRPIDGL